MKKILVTILILFSTPLLAVNYCPINPDDKSIGRLIGGAVIGGIAEELAGRLIDHAINHRPQRPQRPERPQPPERHEENDVVDRYGMIRPHPCPAPGNN